MTETLAAAQTVLDGVQTLVDEIAVHFAKICTPDGKISIDLIDQHQVSLFDFARVAAQVVAARQLLAGAERVLSTDRSGARLLGNLAVLYTAETIRDFQQVITFREAEFGLSIAALEMTLRNQDVIAFLREWLHPDMYRTIGQQIEETGGALDNNLTEEQRALQATFRRFATDKIAPLAERIHREDLLLPDSIIEEIAQLGCFGVSVPARYGGFQDEDHPDHIAMVIMSQELSRASFGTAGSLSTRPELLIKALLKGGSEAQKEKWLPLISSGEQMVAVAVTEPDYGSDVANIRTLAHPVDGGWRLSGTKTWCTFAGRADILMVLARTDPDLTKAHRGLSLFIIEKPPDYGHSFEHRAHGGTISGRAIATLGYRGMHSFEVVFDNHFVPADNLIGGEAGLGRGFYLQMHGFAASRLQTAARALGLMRAAFEAGLIYAHQRQVFGQSLHTYPLTQYKLARMTMLIAATQQLAYHSAREMDQGAGDVEAAMAKLLTARAAEWITREAQQLHGGMGYAEEFAVSRHFVDARLLAIFEGTEEVLALRIIVRALLQRAALRKA